MTANASSTTPPPKDVEPKGLLGLIVRVGNKISDITTLFVNALVIVLLVSTLLSFVNFDYINPATDEKIQIVNILSPPSSSLAPRSK